MNAIRVAIASDEIAALFQSVSEYRAWLLGLIDGLDRVAEAKPREWEPIEHDGCAGIPEQGVESGREHA